MFSSTEKYIGLTLKGRYRIEKFLGEGLRGQAYLAYDSLLEGWVVVKVIKDEIEGFPVPLGEEWTDEPKKAMQVRSQPHIAAILDLGDEYIAQDGESVRVPYIVWEHIDGTSFEELIKSPEKVSIKDIIEFAKQFCSTIAFLRGRKLNHGDLHPRNVMLLRYPGGEVAIKLIDFGMAHNVLTTRARHDDVTGALNILNQLVDKLMWQGGSQEEIANGSMLRDLVRSAGNLLPVGKMTIEEFSAGVDELHKYIITGDGHPGQLGKIGKLHARTPGSGELPAFFGRGKELEQIIDVCRKAFTQRFTRRINILGDPGSGKSAFLERVMDEFRHLGDILLLEYDVNPSDYQKPYSSLDGFWRTLTQKARGKSKLESILDNFPHLKPHFEARIPEMISLFPVHGPKSQAAESCKPIAEHLGGLIRDFAKLIPLTVVFDDLHHADIETVRWLDSLGVGEAGVSLVSMTAYSLVELNFIAAKEGHPLRKKPANDLYTTSVSLGKLDTKEVEQLISSVFTFGISEECTRFTEFILGESGGEPFCIREIVDECINKGYIISDPHGRWHIQKEIEGFVLPKTIEAHVARKLMRLNMREMSVIKLAACYGQSFPPDGINSVSGMEQLDFNETVQSLAGIHNLIQKKNDDLWVFTRPVTRKCLLQGIPHTEFRKALKAITTWQISRARVLRHPGFYMKVSRNLAMLDMHGKASGFAVAAARSYIRLRQYDRAYLAAERALELGRDRKQITNAACQVLALKSKMESSMQLARYDDFLDACEHLDNLGVSTKNIKLRLDALLRKVLALRLRCDYDAAESQVGEVIKLARLHNKPGYEGDVLRELGTIHYLRGRFEEAISAMSKSAKVLDRIKDRHSAAKTYNNLGLVYQQVGDYALMEECIRKAIELYREVGDKNGERLPLANLGLFHQQVGRYDEAKSCFEDILSHLKSGENPVFEAKARLSLAQVKSAIGKTCEANDMADKALQLFTEMNDKQGQAEAMSMLGDIAIDEKHYNLAKEYHKRSLNLKEEIGSEMGIYHSKLRLARLAMQEGKFDIALSLAQEVTIKAKDKGWTRLTIEGITETIRALSEKEGPAAALKVLENDGPSGISSGDPATARLDYYLAAAQAYFENGLSSETLNHLNLFEEYYSRVLGSIKDPEVRHGFEGKMQSQASRAAELRENIHQCHKNI